MTPPGLNTHSRGELAQQDERIRPTQDIGSGGETEGLLWEKVLWRKQPYEDNYVPPTFLAELNDIPPRPRPKLFALFIAALPISQHLSTIGLFLGVFHGLLHETLGAGLVGWSCVGLGVLGYGVYRYGWGSTRRKEAGYIPSPTPLRQLVLPPLLLSLLSPVLKSLTSSTASDSIWPLSGLLFFVHILLADFSTGEDNRRKRRRRKLEEERKRRGSVSDKDRYVVEEKSLTSSLSLTSALSASIVLASRLPSTSHVFSFIFLSILLFSGWPNIAKGVRESGKIWSFGLTISMILLAISFFPISEDSEGEIFSGYVLVFLGVLGTVNIGAPLALRFAWRWKTTRGGGWDAAKVTLKRRDTR